LAAHGIGTLDVLGEHWIAQAGKRNRSRKSNPKSPPHDVTPKGPRGAAPNPWRHWKRHLPGPAQLIPASCPSLAPRAGGDKGGAPPASRPASERPQFGTGRTHTIYVSRAQHMTTRIRPGQAMGDRREE
jgi:hypothetical protein